MVMQFAQVDAAIRNQVELTRRYREARAAFARLGVATALGCNERMWCDRYVAERFPSLVCLPGRAAVRLPDDDRAWVDAGREA